MQTADDAGAPLTVTVQADTLVRVKAAVKLREISKSVLNVVVGLSCIWYCEFVERAVLGVAEVEATVKLTDLIVIVSNARMRSNDVYLWIVCCIRFEYICLAICNSNIFNREGDGRVQKAQGFLRKK